MKVVILAGGQGSRLAEETQRLPKPMVEIGGKPILWHIMKIYSHYGFHEFVICLGYKGYMIKEYFANYFLHNSDATIDVKNNKVEVHSNKVEPWKVTLVDTGEETLTGGRIKRIASYVGNEPFLLTYGDGVGDVDINKLVAAHRQHGKLVTVTAIQPEGRFGALKIDGSLVNEFGEKIDNEASWVNGGFFVVQPAALQYISGDQVAWEKEPLEKLAKERQLAAYQHTGFWKAMDKLSDKMQLENLWDSGNPPWKVWDDQP